MARENIVYNQHGDPNGTRTRVFAVKVEKALESRPRPTLHLSFPPLRINDLRDRGDAAQGMPRDSAETEGLRSLRTGKPGPKDAPTPGNPTGEDVDG